MKFKDRFYYLDSYQKGILKIMLILTVVFGVFFALKSLKIDYEYRGKTFDYRMGLGKSVYTGELDGKTAVFTVSFNKKVVFEYDDQVCAVYRIKKLPKSEASHKDRKPLELYKDDQVIYRISKNRFSVEPDEGSVEPDA